MTDDEHVRLYADGRQQNLPTIRSMRFLSEDPEEDARLEREYFEENRRISEMLAAKGFGIEGNEPLGVQINRHLHIKKVD